MAILGFVFPYYRRLNTVGTWQSIKFANGWIQNADPKVLEVTSLPTEPQPLPHFNVDGNSQQFEQCT